MHYVLIISLLLAGILDAEQGVAQHVLSTDSADKAIHELRHLVAREHSATIAITTDLLATYQHFGDRCALAEVNGFRSTSFTELGKLDSAMSCALRAMELYTSACDSTVLVRGYVALSRLYLALQDFSTLDSICDVGLALWRPSYEPVILYNALLTNKAIGLARQNDLVGAKQIFKVILNLAESRRKPQEIEDASANMGVIMKMTSEFDSAAYFYNNALLNARKNKSAIRIANNYSNLAKLAHDRKQYNASLPLWDSALVYAIEAKNLEHQVRIHEHHALDLMAVGRPAEAYEHSLLRYALNDSILNSEKVLRMAEMKEKFETEKKEREILTLQAEQLNGKLENTRITRSRDLMVLGGSAIVLLAFGLWHRLDHVSRSRAEIKKERDISEGLLHNILPEQVAEEIKTKGYADVNEFETATILFTDFIEFSSISEKLTATELVREIDICWRAFDSIVEKYGVEKIKTIGDAYMAVGGLPDIQKGDPGRVVLAALEMQEFMAKYRVDRLDQQKVFFEMRLGLHTGPVIAGIVGAKKYAYDIWGDAVNTARRMEFCGEAGRVNISRATYEKIKELPDLRFTPRGFIHVKGKGEVEMFFVEKA
ncbi:MAG TPA: adenylate/guanylate cyclase domain-containing protein [Flavobacteriales bacterium]|nr:adenylate/guanylate cyclase domain-containing protein [Flavobacteriales bacterium]